MGIIRDGGDIGSDFRFQAATWKQCTWPQSGNWGKTQWHLTSINLYAHL